ncbi:MAG: pilin [bacterium]
MSICKQTIILGSLLFILFFGVNSVQAGVGGTLDPGCCYWTITDPNDPKVNLNTADMDKSDCPAKLIEVKAEVAKTCPTCTVSGNWSPYSCSDLTGGSGSGSSSSTTTSSATPNSTTPNNTTPSTILTGGKLGGLDTTAGRAGFSEKSLTNIAGNALKIILSFVGVIFLLLMIYGGFTWMTAGGNEKTAGKGKTIITAAVIGLIVVVAAYAITTFVGKSIVP